MSRPFHNSIETNPEHIPTAEEVHAVFEELIGKGKEYKELIKSEDQRGLYRWDVEVPGELEHEKIKYEYMRKGHYGNMGIIETEIHVTYFENGVPVSGTSAAKYIDGQWKIIK